MSIDTSKAEALIQAAKAGQSEPVMEYIRSHYNSWEQFPIMSWMIENLDGDQLIVDICRQLGAMDKEVFLHPSGNRFLFDEPLSIAFQKNRPGVIEELSAAILMHHAPFITGFTHAIVLAALTRQMSIVRAYIRVCGTDFINDPELLHVILYEDFVELMDFCLKAGTDPQLLLQDGRTLYEAATSDEMRRLLDDRTSRS